MLYKILLIPARLFIRYYFRKIVISNRNLLSLKGPLLIASNHPNSFLDAIIIGALFKYPIYSLTRGDVFAGSIITRILTSLNMLPVYRISEGSKKLGYNYATFEVCRNIFKNNGIVLIFSEARSINEWHLRPLRKGTARLAFSAWENNMPLQVLPVGINYSSFRSIGKKIIINFGDVIVKEDIEQAVSIGVAINKFNAILYNQLSDLVFENTSNDHALQRKYFYHHQSMFLNMLLFMPAMVGYIFNAPLYYVIHLTIKNKANDHYDSIMLGLIFFTYPVYILGLTLFAYFLLKNSIAFILFFLIPLTAMSFIGFKKI